MSTCTNCGHDRHEPGVCITIGPSRYPGNCFCPGEGEQERPIHGDDALLREIETALQDDNGGYVWPHKRERR